MMNSFTKWGKRLLTGFFVLIFTLGFFSKSLMNLTLPNVQIAELNDGVEVNYTSEMGGNIVAKKTEDVCVLGDAIIQEVYVKKGSYIVPGTPLFKIDMSIGLQNKMNASLLHSKIQTERERMNTLLSKSKLDNQTRLAQVTVNLAQAEKDLSAQKELLASGAVTKDTVEQAESRYNTLKADKSTIENNYQLQKAQDQVAINEIKDLIDSYEQQLSMIEAGKNKYYDISPLGEVLSKNKGYMLTVPEKGNAYKTGEVLSTIGVCNSYKDLAFEMRMSQRDYYLMRESGCVVSISTMEDDYIGVVAFDYSLSVFSDGEMKVMANFTDEPAIKTYPGQEVASRSQNSYYVGGEKLAVPRTAIVSSGTTLNGTNALIYLLREEEDALGKSQIAVAMPVTVTSVGDEYAIISELRNMPTNKVILNPTAKIKDGTKVYVCP